MLRLNFWAIENSDSPGMTVYSLGGAVVVVVDVDDVEEVDVVVVTEFSSPPTNDETTAASENTNMPAANDHWRRPRNIIVRNRTSRAAPRDDMGERRELVAYVIAHVDDGERIAC